MEGRSRIRWIRFLIVVLALTASRGIFPLHNRSGHPPTHQALSSTVPKYEGVVPSRRLLESQRNDRAQARLSDPGLPTSPRLAFVEQESFQKLVGVRTPRAIELLATSARPDYLKFFLHAASTSSLPPPV